MKNGFTLVELLAVIVILAAIALITIPLMLNTMNNSKKKTLLFSAESYVNLVEQKVLEKNLDKKFNPDMCDINKDGNLKCGDENIIISTEGNKPTGGTLYFKTKDVVGATLKYHDDVLKMNSDGEMVYLEDYNPCKVISGKENTIGSKYECEVKPNENYNFYVLSLNADGTTNLIMDRNINSDGTPADDVAVTKQDNPIKYNLEEWQTSGTNVDGPVTVIEFLYNATKDWINVNPIDFIYKDREFQGIEENTIGYESFISSNGVAVITSGTTPAVKTTVGTIEMPLRARLPIYSYKDNVEYGELSELKSDNSNIYLYENSTAGYWSLSSYHSDYSFAWNINGLNLIYAVMDGGVSGDESFQRGVRPVITVKL